MNESSEFADVSPVEAAALLSLDGPPVPGPLAVKLTLLELIVSGHVRFSLREPTRKEGLFWSVDRTLRHDTLALTPPRAGDPLPDRERLSALGEILSELAEPGKAVDMMVFACLLRERYDADYPRFVRECVLRDLTSQHLVEERIETHLLLIRTTRLRSTIAGEAVCRRWRERMEALPRLVSALEAADEPAITAAAREAGLALTLQDAFTEEYERIAACLRTSGILADHLVASWLEALSRFGPALDVGLTTFSEGLKELYGYQDRRTINDRLPAPLQQAAPGGLGVKPAQSRAEQKEEQAADRSEDVLHRPDQGERQSEKRQR